MSKPWLKRWRCWWRSCRGQKTAQINPSKQVYLGIDGIWVNARAQNRFMEAKVGIVFSHQLAAVGTNRRQLLDKQYVGTLKSVQAFSQQLFTRPRSTDIDNQD